MKVRSGLTVILALAGLTAASSSLAAETRVGVGFAVHHRGPGRAYVSTVRAGRLYGFYPYGIHQHHVVAIKPGNVGRVDFNVTPKSSQVFVDGAYMGIAGDFSGGIFGDTAALQAGVHRIKVVSPDGKEVVRKVYIQPGKKLDFDVEF